MPTFQYEAVNAAGKEQKGVIEASDNADAQAQLKAQGYFPTLVEEAKVKGRQKKSGKDVAKNKKKRGGGFSISIGKVNLKKMTTFTRQLSTLQDAGLPLLRSMQILESQQRPAPPCPTRWPSIPRPSTVSTPRWSRPARWAACWTSSSSVSPTSWRRASG
jgi:type IV pilus assembly protein PilC